MAAERVVAIEDFVAGDGKTNRCDDELVVGVELRSGAGGSSAYSRFSRVDGDYPVVTAAVRLEWTNGKVGAARIAVGGCGSTAYRVREAERNLAGLARVDDIPASLFEAYVEAADPATDLKGSADYRRMLIPGLLRRSLRQAFAGRPVA
jgi:carbon-monoxide dehydrogenase medium subunit